MNLVYERSQICPLTTKSILGSFYELQLYLGMVTA